jgi:hypothetical protein
MVCSPSLSGTKAMGPLSPAIRVCLILAVLLPGAFLIPQANAERVGSEAAENWTTDSPVFSKTPISPYFDFKEQVHEKTGLTWMVNYSIMTQGRPENPYKEADYNSTGQLDLIGIVDFDFRKVDEDLGKGKAVVFYMYLHQIGGLTTSDFGELNGNITPINDSNPVHFLRQAYYQHEFFDDRLLIMGGIIEPPLVFAINRFAIDDRVNFMALPMATIGAKDRIGSSAGGLIKVKVLPWLSLGASLNELTPDESEHPFPPDLVESKYYSFLNLTLDLEVPHLGQGIYRINAVFVDSQGKNSATSGVVLSFDQDLGENWGAFLRYDDTEFQTLTSPLYSTVSFGFYNRAPFGRQGDRFGAGAFQSRSTQGGDFKEWGGEVFYKIALARWFDFSTNLQIFDAAKSDDTFVTLGSRFYFSF